MNAKYQQKFANYWNFFSLTKVRKIRKSGCPTYLVSKNAHYILLFYHATHMNDRCDGYIYRTTSCCGWVIPQRYSFLTYQIRTPVLFTKVPVGTSETIPTLVCVCYVLDTYFSVLKRWVHAGGRCIPLVDRVFEKRKNASEASTMGQRYVTNRLLLYELWLSHFTT